LASNPTLDSAAPGPEDLSAEVPSLPKTLTGETAPPTLFERLPNGLTLLLRESHRAPVVELQIWAGVGSADERKGEEGLAHFHEHMLFKGTEKRGVGDVAGDIEGLGGHINAYTSFDQTVYHATLPAAAWREGLDVLTDAIRYSRFDAEEVEREREVVLEEIRRSEDTPSHVLGDLAFRECYRKHPYGAPILGPAENVASFDRERVRRFFQRWYTPENLMVVAVGDFDRHEVAAEIERLFADARPGKARRKRPEEPASTGLRVAILRRPFEGHRVDLSWPASRFCEDDAIHLDLLAYVLGECESSRLVRSIREEEALVDRIDAGAYTPLDRGLFSIGFETDGPRLEQAIARIVEETDRLRREPVSQAELERARINFLASEQFERESVSGVASKLGSYESMGGGWRREGLALEILRRATPDDLLRVAHKYLEPDALAVAALIPESTDPALDEAALRRSIARGLEAARVARTSNEHPEPSPGGDVPAESRRITAGGHQGLALRPLRPAADGAGERLDATLPNGLAVHVLRRPEVPIVAARFACLGGLLAEDDSSSGITRFLNAMWTRGTRSLSAAEFARQSEALAADIDGFSGRNSLGLTLDSLSETLDAALGLFAEALLEPRFDAEEIERERRETLAALERREDRLGQRAFQLFTQTEFERHPYRLTVLGERAAIEGITAEQLEAHSARLVCAKRAALSIVGDVDPEKVVRLVADRLAGLAAGDDRFEIPEVGTRGIGVRESELIKDRSQAHLVVGFRGVTMADPDRDTLELISQLLAGQGGRLFLELRDRQSLAYTVSASNVEGLVPGYFSLYIATAPDKLARARRGIFEEIDRLVSQAPSSDELERAIRFGIGSFAIDSQRSHARAAHIALDSIYGLGPDHADEYPRRIAAIRPADVLRVAQRIFRTDACTISAVHPAAHD
jgi:zinc protease